MNTSTFRRIVVLAGMIFLTSAWSGPASAAKRYTVVTVEKGGVLQGIVTLNGKIPKTRRIKVTKDKKACGDFVIDESLTVNKKGGIVNAVIEILGISQGKDWDLPDRFIFDQKGCAFTPHVMIVKPRAPGQVQNSDPVKHNVHTISKGIFSVNKTVSPGKSMKVRKKRIKKAGIIRVKCDFHKWMRGWWIVPQSPYVALSDANGQFVIRDIPPGRYKVRIWQERLGTTVKEAEIHSRRTTELKISLKRKR